MPVLDDIRQLIDTLMPGDEMERAHLESTREWARSTDDLFRRDSDEGTPSPHLVSYFLVLDRTGRILLGDHRKSGLWLPAGGHVEPGEHPVDTVTRECREELGIDAQFHPDHGRTPVLLTVTDTVPVDGRSHTDVSLWFVLLAEETDAIEPDPREYHRVRWWTREEIEGSGKASFDPHQMRAVARLAAIG